MYRGDAYNDARTVHLGGNDITALSEACNDFVGPGDCNAFSVTRQDRLQATRLNWVGENQNEFENFVADYWVQSWPFGHLHVTSLKSNLVYAAQAAARTNPSRPYVDLPVSLLELGDVTQLIRDSGRRIIRNQRQLRAVEESGNFFQEAGRHNIRYQFGIAPLVSDLWKLTRFRAAFKQRVTEVKRLQGPKGLRRTLAIDSGCNTSYRPGITIQSNLRLVHQDQQLHSKEDVRAHVRWRASGFQGRLPPDDPAMEWRIRRALLGLTVDSSTLWEAMPWSWLIDWGSTVGDYFKANRNIIPASLVGVWIHRHRSTEYYMRGTKFAGGAGTMSTGIAHIDLKSRSASTPVAPVAHFPFLSGKQVGILASLAVTRM